MNYRSYLQYELTLLGLDDYLEVILTNFWKVCSKCPFSEFAVPKLLIRSYFSKLGSFKYCLLCKMHSIPGVAKNRVRAVAVTC